MRAMFSSAPRFAALELAGLGAAASLALGVAFGFAADNEAGVSLSPAEAAGGWTLKSAGHAICRVDLFATGAGSTGFGARASNACGNALPAGVAGWTPTADGMALTGADGQALMPFARWSNSLFVSHRGSGADVQLMRGPPNP